MKKESQKTAESRSSTPLLGLNLKKIVFSLGALLAAQAIVPSHNANAIIVSIFEEDPQLSDRCCCAGMITLFFCPPLGIALSADEISSKFGNQLEFLKNTAEGQELEKLLLDTASSVVIKGNEIEIKEDQFRNLQEAGYIVPDKALFLKSFTLIHIVNRSFFHRTKLSKVEVYLATDMVKTILAKGDYSDEQIAQAVDVLCRDEGQIQASPDSADA